MTERMVSVPDEDLLFYKLKDLILEQSEGEWDDATIVRDAHHFANHIRPLLTAAPVREEGGAEDEGRLFAEVPLGTAALYRDLENGTRPILATREEAPDWTARTDQAWAENNSEEAVAGEEAAWIWLNGHVECAPADRAYSADEMVDAFMAGAGRSDRLVKALERIADEHQYRSGYCQDDITVEPALTAEEAQTVAREALRAHPPARSGEGQ